MRFAGITAMLAASLLAACSGGGSGAAALEKQLVGHWSNVSNDHMYFGETDPGSKIGSYILVHPDGKAFTHRYKIESTDAGDRTIRVNLLFATGDTREELLVLSKDGKSMDRTTTITGFEIQSQVTRADDNTAP